MYCDRGTAKYEILSLPSLVRVLASSTSPTYCQARILNRQGMGSQLYSKKTPRGSSGLTLEPLTDRSLKQQKLGRGCEYMVKTLAPGHGFWLYVNCDLDTGETPLVKKS